MNELSKASRKPMASSASSVPAVRRGYGGRSAQELLQERHVRLLEAGLTLFCTLGYQHTRIDVIC